MACSLSVSRAPVVSRAAAFSQRSVFTFACCRLQIGGIARRSSRGSTRWFCIGCSSVIRALSREKRRISGRMDGVVMLGLGKFWWQARENGEGGGEEESRGGGEEEENERTREPDSPSPQARSHAVASAPKDSPTADRRAFLVDARTDDSLARSHHPAPGL